MHWECERNGKKWKIIISCGLEFGVLSFQWCQISVEVNDNQLNWSRSNICQYTCSKIDGQVNWTKKFTMRLAEYALYVHCTYNLLYMIHNVVNVLYYYIRNLHWPFKLHLMRFDAKDLEMYVNVSILIIIEKLCNSKLSSNYNILHKLQTNIHIVVCI